MAITQHRPRNDRSPAALNMPMPEARTLALLGHLGLGEADLRADQLRHLLGEVVDERPERRVVVEGVLVPRSTYS